MDADVPQPSTVPPVEDMDASHMRNDSLVTVRLSEPVHPKADTKLEEESPVDQPKLDDSELLKEDTILEEVEEDGEERKEDDEERQEEDDKRKEEDDKRKEEDDERKEEDEEHKEEGQVLDWMSRSSGISTVKPEGQSLAAELEGDSSSRPGSRPGSTMSNLNVETQNLATELAAEETTIESRRASRVNRTSRLSKIITDTQGKSFAPETKEQSPGSRRTSDDSQDGEVNWAELQQNEADEPKDQESDESTALLLARLEQENNSIVTNPKSGLQSPTITRPRGQSRPPSIQQLKKMVDQPAVPSLRYSLLPAPPMTDLEFYAALVRDYPKTLRKLPTLVSKKVRGGIPHPLRGVVWQSMAGSRDQALEEQYERLSGETSPYEVHIGKDIGRCFPGVDLFRDPDGDGQRDLGNVLKAFSLYDPKIGYCQGLGFIVGPLLMNMPDKAAFCVLVKLMEQYDLRDCFLPDLSGLHVRIYQFRELLKQHLPKVSAHLELLQIEPAYVSQWFLSFFAVTCPLPMLFRIFDVIFAEGASETLMRVALSLMRKNEAKILACVELEDAMQLLLSRGIWDCYYSNADNLVNDFVTFSGVVNHQTLQNLAAAYRNPEVRTSEIASFTQRFLGRLWTGSTTPSKSTTSLSPGVSSNRPKSFLRRSTSKQSIASTLNSIEGGSDSIMSIASTDATTISRDSSNTDKSFDDSRKTIMSTMSKKDMDLHAQIEDLLTAMSELQREYAELDTRLQREKEEREEDKVTVRALLCGLTRKARMEALRAVEGDKPDIKANTEIKDFNALSEDNAASGPPPGVDPASWISPEEMNSLLDVVEDRFQTEKDKRRSSIVQSKSQLRDELARSKEQLSNEMSKSKDLTGRLAAQEQEISNLRDQVRDSHTHIRNTLSEKHKLERQVSEMRQAARTRGQSPATSPDGSEVDGRWSGRSSTTYSGGSVAGTGLRELRLGRPGSSKSGMTSFAKRSSSLHNPMTQVGADKKERGHNTSSISSVESATSNPAPPSNIADNETLLQELVDAKTAKIMAEQEVEELKGQLNAMRKMMAKNGDGADQRSSSSTEKSTAQGVQGAFMSYMNMNRAVSTASATSVETKASVPASTPAIVATPPSKETTPEPKAAAPAAGWGWAGWGKK